jgi:short-subunit dehydrogenase
MELRSDGLRPLAVITGASEGIGRDLAFCYARGGYDVTLVARREHLLNTLAEEVRAVTQGAASCRVIPVDLSDSEGCETLLTALAAEKQRLRAFVNNAGFGTLGWFHEVTASRHLDLIELNISALTHLCHGVLPWLRENGTGHILNIASVASFQPGPLMSTYYASKAYVLSLSEALHNESRGTGVTVCVACPGPTRTGFARVAGISPHAPAGGAPAMDSDEVAALCFAAATSGRSLVIPGFRNRIASTIGRYAPRAWTAELVRRIQLRRLGPRG